jgi:catechol 2,3-dioxygenase-like lactoylglutathione lyase family enzyme
MMSAYLFKGLAHIGIMTDNPQKCVDFYCKNLGFRPIMWRIWDRSSLYSLKTDGMVIEFVGVGAKPENGTVDHIAIEVQGIEALVEDLKAKGVMIDGDVAQCPRFSPTALKTSSSQARRRED